MRILVTRPAHDARRTAEKLQGLGHEALCAPLLTIAPTLVLPPVLDYDILIITSANGAAQLARLPGWEGKRVYAVGPRCAEAIRQQGTPAELVIANGDAVSILALLKDFPAIGTTVLHLTGVDHKAEPDATLRARGFTVYTWTAYQARAETKLPQSISSALLEKRLDAVLHYSRRSAQISLELVTKSDLQESFSPLLHFCLSEDVAAPLRSAGIKTLHIAKEPSDAALLALLP